MKNLILIIVTFILIISCQTKSKQNPLLYVNHVNKLEFRIVDDKCGEWGGNEKNLTIYRDDFKSPLLADYIEKTKTCDTGIESEITYSIKRIKLTQEENELIVETINELCENKINREDYPTHSGISNRIMLSDSSMIINDFPSADLTKFKELTSKFKNQ